VAGWIRAADLILMTVPAFPAPDEIVEDIRMQIGAVGPPALLPQVVAVPGDVVALVLAHQHAIGIDKFLAQSVGHGPPRSVRALPLWLPAAIPT
jgi:hypothetical protein